MPNIAIIGAGIAGLSAATKLVQQGYDVTVFETSTQLGGRARTVSHQGLDLDNGQHILLGAYHETLGLLKSVGVNTEQTLKRLPLALLVKDLQSHHHFALKAAKHMPAPLHIAWGLLNTKGVKGAEKLKTLRFLVGLKLTNFKLKKDESVSSLLNRQNQPQRLIQCLWEPLCLAALNTPIAQASAQVFLNVLRDSFAKDKHDADLLLPSTDLTALIAQPLANFIRTKDSHIHTGTTIKNIVSSQKSYQIITKDSRDEFSHVIIACGPHQLKAFQKALPNIAIPTFDYQAITTVYLQYDSSKKLPEPMIGMVNSLSQWVFDRGQLYHQHGLLAVVISAYATDSQAELVETVTHELAQAFPDLGKLQWSKVITEKRATFSCDVGIDRPSNQTAYPHLYLAGDYTAGDYPATIEGAVRSGLNAAALILND